MQITINDVRLAVHHALGTAFPAVVISSVEPNPALDDPYFLVRLLEFTQAHELGDRYRRSFPFVIQYVAAEQSIDDKYEVAEQMMAAVKQITVGSHGLSGKSLRIEMIEGELHVFVTYTMLVREQQAELPKMQSLEEGIAVE